jgi:hypothetical protein
VGFETGHQSFWALLELPQKQNSIPTPFCNALVVEKMASSYKMIFLAYYLEIVVDKTTAPTVMHAYARNIGTLVISSVSFEIYDQW